MCHLIKDLLEVQDDEIRLYTTVSAGSDVMGEGEELGLTASLISGTISAVSGNVM